MERKQLQGEEARRQYSFAGSMRKFASKQDTREVDIPLKQSITIAEFEVLPFSLRLRLKKDELCLQANEGEGRILSVLADRKWESSL